MTAAGLGVVPFASRSCARPRACLRPSLTSKLYSSSSSFINPSISVSHTVTYPNGFRFYRNMPHAISRHGAASKVCYLQNEQQRNVPISNRKKRLGSFPDTAITLTQLGKFQKHPHRRDEFLRAFRVLHACKSDTSARQPLLIIACCTHPTSHLVCRLLRPSPLLLSGRHLS